MTIDNTGFLERLEWNLTNHRPSDAEVIERMERVRWYAKQYVKEVADSCPDSQERDLFAYHLEQANMWAIAAIARHQQ